MSIESFKKMVKTVLSEDLELDDAYLLPNFSGMEYRFSKTDVVFSWTKGGYQIGRDQNDHPVFFDVYQADAEKWQSFFEDIGIDTTIGRRMEGEGIHFILYAVRGMKIDRVETTSVTPLDQTVEWAKQCKANFRPALEMLDEMYDLDIGFEYR